MHWDVCYC